jgi:hypothetical protein
MVLGEPAGQRRGQVGQPARSAHPADRQVRQHLPAPLRVDQALDDQPGGLAGQVRRHRAELDHPTIPAPWRATGSPACGLHGLGPLCRGPKLADAGSAGLGTGGGAFGLGRRSGSNGTFLDAYRFSRPGRRRRNTEPAPGESAQAVSVIGQDDGPASWRDLGPWAAGPCPAAPARCWQNARMPGAVAAGPGQCGLASRDVGPDAAVLVAGP